MFGEGWAHIFHLGRAEHGKRTRLWGSSSVFFQGGCRVPVLISCLFPSAYKCVFRLIVSAYN